MVDSEYCPDNCKSSKIRICAIRKNPEMLRLVFDHLKSKRMCQNAVIRYVIDQYRPEKICDKAIL